MELGFTVLQPSDVDAYTGLDQDTGDSRLPSWAAQMWLTLLTEGESWTPDQIKAYVDGARTSFKAQG